MITSRYIEVLGVKIYVESNNGPKDSGTILCFGSAGRDTRPYHGLMEAMEDSYEVIAFDMPGHGKSMPLNQAYFTRTAKITPEDQKWLDKGKSWLYTGKVCLEEYHDYCGFIIEALKVLDIQSPICVGHALGGNVVFYLAQRIPVKAIVSMAGSDYSPTVSQAVIDGLDHPYCSVQHSHIDFTDSLIGSGTTKKNREFILWGVYTETGRVKKADYGGVYNGFDVREDMDKVTCPVLILRGAEDWTAHDETLEPMIARLKSAPKVTYITMPGMGHYNPQEDPERIAGLIMDFIDEAKEHTQN